LEIIGFEPDMAEGVARCYSEMVAPAPYCEPVGGEWFADLTRLERQPLTEEEILVAQHGSEAVGFAHVGVAAPSTDDWHCKGEPGVIRFLAYRQGQRPVGAALLGAAERWARERDRKRMVAGHCNFLYPFYHLPFGHISERISHLPPLFGMAGYAIEESEVFFAWRDFEPRDVSMPDVDVEVVSEWRDQVETFGPGVVLHPKRGDKTFGECNIVRLGWDTWVPEMKEWCFCTSLHIDEPLQGKGLGKHMLSLGLREASKRGLRHAMISTDWNNYRAYLFYTNFGFAFLDRTFAFRKELGSDR
jgi:GNAT superfamily N-acetyltransferase